MLCMWSVTWYFHVCKLPYDRVVFVVVNKKEVVVLLADGYVKTKLCPWHSWLLIVCCCCLRYRLGRPI